MRPAILLVCAAVLAACEPAADGHVVVGTLEREPVALSAERAEPVAAVAVREGQRVDAGALLLSLDPTRALAEHRGLEARRDRLQRRFDEVARGPRAERVLAARARLHQAEAALHEAELEFARVTELRRGNLASAQQRDRAETVLEQARAERDAARAAVDELVSGATDEQLAQAAAALAEAEAALAVHQVTLERLELRAPRDAIVEALPFVVGETPAAGAVVVRLRALDAPPYARVYLPSALHARLAPGDGVRVQVQDAGGFDGTVRYLSPEAAYTPYFALTEHDAGRLSYLAEIDLAGADALPSGLPVRVVVPRE